MDKHRGDQRGYILMKVPQTLKFQDRVPAHWVIERKGDEVVCKNLKSQEEFKGTIQEFVAKL
jgi:hypothetical protein